MKEAEKFFNEIELFYLGLICVNCLIESQNCNSVKHDNEMLESEHSSHIVDVLENVFLIWILAKGLYTFCPIFTTKTLVLKCIPDRGAGPDTDHVWTNAEVFKEIETRL